LPWTVLTAAVAALLAGGCGHPATQGECEEILNRIVDLELKSQNVIDPAEVEKRRASTLTSSGLNKTELLRDCVGKHITDRAMICVRSAATSDEITDKCLR
jgi:hypothetical protein